MAFYNPVLSFKCSEHASGLHHDHNLSYAERANIWLISMCSGSKSKFSDHHSFWQVMYISLLLVSFRLKMFQSASHVMEKSTKGLEILMCNSKTHDFLLKSPIYQI